MTDGYALLGAGLVIVGTWFLLWMKKRKFDRTNSAGVEQFRSYGKKLTATFGDKVLETLAIASLGGGTLILAFRFVDTWGWMVILPLTPLLLFLL